MAPKTPARSNLARSNAARSGWPVLAGVKVPLYALSNVARSNATRSNYTSNKTFISIGGVPVGEGGVVGGAGILARSVTMNDSMNDVPTTAQMTFYKYVPVEGADLIITLGSKNNLRREFGGTVMSTLHRYVGDKPVDQNMVYDAQLIDYSWGLNRKKVSGNFTNASVATIAAAIMAAGAPGYTLYVAPDIGATILDQITYSEQTPADALHQLVKRVGGDWFCDYSKVVQVFYTFTAESPPQILNRAHTSFRDLQWTRDLSQVVTRVYTDCGGSEALEAVAVGATLIPVGTVAWYEVGGGVVLIGQQRVNYTGINAGGGGSLVGPGAAPSAAINAAVVPGAGVTAGLHDYAVTYVTASGESIPSPRTTVNVGVIAAPTAAPALDTTKYLAAGTGPDPGMHDYALTFVASSGETTPGPRLTLSSATVTPAPTTGPTPTPGAIGVGPDPGVHDYAVVYQTWTGFTTPGPIGGQISIGGTPIPAPTASPTTNPATAGGNVDVGTHWYYLTFLTANGETNTAPPTQGTAAPGSQVADPATYPGTANSGSTNNVTGGWLYYSYAYRAGGGETRRSPAVEVMATLAPGPPSTYYNVAVTAPASPDPTVTTIVFYRAFSSGSNPVQWATSGNVQSTFTDSCTVFGPSAPTGGNTTPITGTKQTIPLTAIQTGPAGTTARRIYRTPAGGGVQHLLTTINNNSTTTYTDTTSDSALASQPGPPGSNTALVLTAVHLTNIPRGTGADAQAVAYRLIYRRSGGQGLRYVGALMDNSATTFEDTLSNAALTTVPPASNTAYLQQLPLTLPLGGAFIVNRKLYRTKVNTGGGTLFLVASFDNVQTTYTDVTADSGLGAAAPAVNNAIAAQVQLSSIPLGAAAVTSRRLYRTAAGASQLKLLVTLGDNVTTIANDATADAGLGVNAPTSDTSLLAQPAGNVLQGSPTLPVASVASFLPSGGWVIAASQIIRYTGITGNSLTGIPTSGPGSIGATMTYNSTIVAAPMLTGVPTTGSGTLRYPILKGDPVDVFVQVDDLPGQAAVRLQLPGSDGIIEDEIQDRRLSATEGRARARARLNLLAALDTDGKVGLVTVTYVCRDINTRAGRTVSINIGPPINLRGDFLIQRVTASKFYVPNHPPTYQVEASSVKFSYEELLRFIRDAGE